MALCTRQSGKQVSSCPGRKQRSMPSSISSLFLSLHNTAEHRQWGERQLTGMLPAGHGSVLQGRRVPVSILLNEGRYSCSAPAAPSLCLLDHLRLFRPGLVYAGWFSTTQITSLLWCSPWGLLAQTQVPSACTTAWSVLEKCHWLLAQMCSQWLMAGMPTGRPMHQPPNDRFGDRFYPADSHEQPKVFTLSRC